MGVVRGDDRRAVAGCRPTSSTPTARAACRPRRRTSARTCGARSWPSGSASSASASSCGGSSRRWRPSSAWSARRTRRPVLQLVRPPHGREADAGRRPARRLTRSCPRWTTAGWPWACGSSRTAVPELAARAGALYDVDGLRLLLPARASTGSCSTTCPTPAHAPCCYDTVVSESRIADYIGIARARCRRRPTSGAGARSPTRATGVGRRRGRSASTRRYFGVNVFEGAYPYAGMLVTPSWSGSMFEALMPDLFVPEDSGRRAAGASTTPRRCARRSITA